MKKNKSLKDGKGITLIALIITIIIMLILVAVTVSVLINSGIIGKAQKAKTDTQAAYDEESRLGDSITIDGIEYSIDEYINLKTLNIDVIDINGDILETITIRYDDTIVTWQDFLDSDFSNSDWTTIFLGHGEYVVQYKGCGLYHKENIDMNCHAEEDIDAYEWVVRTY